jgi:Fic family protein
MSIKRRIIPNTTANLRFEWFSHLGGLSSVSVRNKEWMDLLKEDTRNSLMIEGYFVTRADIIDIIENPKYSKTQYRVLGYFDAAFASYELAFQQFQTNEYRLTKSIIRQIHSLMFRGDPNFSWSPGEWRKGDIEITGAKVKTTSPFEIEQKIEKLLEIANAPTDNLVRKLAVVHDLFEQIHPFPDGNGRVGRILLNFILVAHGYPNIAIKGTEKDRLEYINALELADPLVSELIKNSFENPFDKPLIPLEEIINRSLAIALDVVICNKFSQTTTLLSLADISKLTGRPIQPLRVACAQKKLICSKIGSKVMSHPNLFVPPIR